MTPYLVVIGVAGLVAYMLTPGVRVMSIKLGVYCVPKDRSVHHSPIPTLGGVSIFAAFVVAVLVAAAFPDLRQAFRFTEVFGLLVGGVVALALGIADDVRDLGPPRFAGQVLAAGILYQFGVKMSFFWLPWLGVLSLSADMSALLTILWVVVLMNAVNYIDGLDGLAAGLTAIAAGAFFVYSLLLQAQGLLGFQPLAPLAAAAITGACIGFLRHNFHPARIFMGDSGATVLGFLLAGATISAVGQTTVPGPEAGRLALPLVFTPIVFIALPITDFVFASLRRAAAGKPIMSGDNSHIHHRMLRLGHSHRQAVLIMYAWALVLGGGLVVAGFLPWGRFLLLFAVAVGTLAVVTIAPRFREGAGGGAGRGGFRTAIRAGSRQAT